MSGISSSDGNLLEVTNLQRTMREELSRKFIEEKELPSYFTTAIKPSVKLRPYQEKCFKYFIAYWESFEGRAPSPQLLFHMATGSGKTLIMAGLMLYLYDKGYRNFLFFVPSVNIIEKTRENFLNPSSSKYLFAKRIEIDNRQVEIRLVENFQNSIPNCINLCLTTTQGLHTSLNTPRENSLTYDDFADKSIVLISDEAHHINTATKKGKKQDFDNDTQLFNCDACESEDWETTVMHIFQRSSTNLPNVLLEFTATMDLHDAGIAKKYEDKIIFNYPLKKFREDGYSKDIEVIQSDLPVVERSLQAIILSQYKRKLFISINQDIKPVVLFKSKTIAENKSFFNLFCEAIRNLSVNDIARFECRAQDDIAAAFSFFKEKGISAENLILELQEDFKEENFLLVDGSNISPEKQIQLNTLESHDNGYRAVFAVDMLNEGWDVLNLFDIVRLYETRDARKGTPGKTTMQEAQLIGRGARYMPFQSPDSTQPFNQRKFDMDLTNRLRVVEKLHYHSSHNPKYITELHTAMVTTGIIPDKYRDESLVLKEDFKQTRLYKEGYVFVNEQETYLINENITSIGDNILSTTYDVHLYSGQMKSDLIFSDVKGNAASQTFISCEMKDLGVNVTRCAINRICDYNFTSLKNIFPNLSSIKEFIESDSYLAKINIRIYGSSRNLGDLTQENKLLVAMNVLEQIKKHFVKGGIGRRGTSLFAPKMIKNIFKDHVQRFAIDEVSDKEFGKPMSETSDRDLNLKLCNCEWYAYNECYGTSEEKHLIKYIESIYERLGEKYDEIYLVRNEKDLKIYSIEGEHAGEACEPDYLLFLHRIIRDNSNKFDNIQIFIEPKGGHLRAQDKWKEDFLKIIREKAEIQFSTQGTEFNIWGMPFFTYANAGDFKNTFQTALNIN